MNLYLLTQTQFAGYNTYDSCVVTAENEHGAKLISPKGTRESYGGNQWAIDNINCELLGVSNSPISQLILSSFNAG